MPSASLDEVRAVGAVVDEARADDLQPVDRARSRRRETGAGATAAILAPTAGAATTIIRDCIGCSGAGAFYQEGTWTPTIRGSSTAGTQGYTAQAG